MNQNNRILITGVAGFIGSHTCEKLLKEGYNIIGVDNINDYYDVNMKRSNLKILEQYDNFTFFKGDIKELTFLETIFNKFAPFENVIHLAAQAGVRYSLTNPFIYQETNIQGTLNLLELSKRYGMPNFVFASSSSVYGNQQKTPFSEDDPVSKPVSIYAATKQAGEVLCYSYHHLYDMNINSLRFFTVYGPRGRPDMSPFIFTKKILTGEKIKLFDNPPGQILRDFTFIDDIVDGIIRAFNYREGFEIFNLGFGQPIKLIDFLNTIEKITGIKANYIFEQRQPGDVDTTFADITKAKKILGFQPKTNVKTGLTKFINWFKSYFNIE